MGGRGPLQVKTGISLVNRNINNVAYLMQTGCQKWNVPLIREIFKPNSADRILGSHLPSNRDIEDEVMWSRKVSGKISAKDAYSLLLSDSNGRESTTMDRVFWGHMWSMNVKPKWKVFLWRLLNRALVVQTNLERRGISVRSKCELCLASKEDEKHLFRDCP